MPKLIALVATAVLINGERTVIQPGEPLPDDLPTHDANELVGSGAAEDLAKSMREDRKAQLADQAAQEEFQQARQRQIAEQKSIAPPPAADGEADAKTNTAATGKAAAKKAAK